MNKPLKLMIPGPIQPDERVMKAMGEPVRPHYGVDWENYYNETLEMLRPVFGCKTADIYLFPGSGSSALDACLGSALSSGEKIIVGVNGFFGDRLVEIAGCYGLEVVTVQADWGSPLDPAAFETALKSNPDASLVAAVHLETSTTVVNPIEGIAAVAGRYGVPMMVDAVSSLGGLPVRMDEWGIDFCASASQKCLGAPPGLGPVAVTRHGWEIIDRNPKKNHGWYLNLSIWREYVKEMADWHHPSPVTMATSNIVALHTSLEGLLEEGLANRLNRYRNLALRLRKGLRKIGMSPFTPDDAMAPVLTAAYGPQGVHTGNIVAYMDAAGIKISGGLGKLKGKIFRIGHMSPVLTEKDIDEVIEALANFKA